MDLHKISKIIAIVIGFLSIAFTVYCMATEITLESGSVDLFIYLAYLSIFLTVGAVMYYVVKNFVNQKDKRETLISVGAFSAIVLVAFIFADGTEVPLKDGAVISSGYSKFISTSLNTFYIIGVASLATLLYSSFGKIKK